RIDGDGDGIADVYRPADAVFGAAKLLCVNGAGTPTRLRAAIWAYNHADWYVSRVIDLAIRYGSSGLEAPALTARAADLLTNPRVSLSADARTDLASGAVDPRLVNILAAAAAHRRIEVGVIRTGHTQFVKGTDRVADHYYA